MALSVTGLTRKFKHGNITLTDPNPAMTPDWVIGFYANTYPELTTATIDGPEIKDREAVYEFKTTVGTKG